MFLRFGLLLIVVHILLLFNSRYPLSFGLGLRAIGILVANIFSNGARFLLNTRHNSARSTSDSQKNNLFAIWQGRWLVLLSLRPSMLEQPMLGKFLRISEHIYRRGTNIMDGGVKLFDLLIVESIAILLRVYLGMI